MTSTNNYDPTFYRIMVAYNFAKVASMMRCKINTHDRGIIPINLYAINLAPSGFSKGHSTNIIEDKVLDGFRDRFITQTFTMSASKRIPKLANDEALKNSTDPTYEEDKITAEFDSLGPLVFSFDSATTAAIRQLRQKLLIANAGSLNLEIDEIGSNLLGNVDALNMYLELYDVGKIKQRLLKNTKENMRGIQIEGNTPANMLLYGTPTKLLDGGTTQEQFKSLLETGFARRCIFGYGKHNRNTSLTAEELYELKTNKDVDVVYQKFSDTLYNLADISNFNKILTMSKEVAIALLDYQLTCEKQANEMKEHEEIQRAELTHRYFKAIKIAGAYAFVENSTTILMKHLHAAIRLVEDSGNAFKDILTRDRPYEKLAKYLADIGKEVTHVDLLEDLSFIPSAKTKKDELINLAIAYGYKNNIVIKKSYMDGIEFFSGESMKETDLSKLIISWSDEITEGYTNDYAPWDKLYKLAIADNLHFTSHHLKD